MSNLDWMDLSACRDEDPDLFHPSSVGIAAQHQAEQAALVCARCPVQRQCGEHRGRTGAASGIWGGSYHRTKPPTAPKPVQHGTDYGYHEHRRRGENACGRCRFAHAEAERERVERAS